LPPNYTVERDARKKRARPSLWTLGDEVRGEVMTRWKRELVEWVRDIRESGLGFALGILLLLGILVGALDVIYWGSDVANNLIAEANGVLAELFLIGIVISIYEYRRRRKEELSAIEKELAQLLVSSSPEGVLRKTQLIDALIAKGRKPSNLRNHKLEKARLNGFDLSGVDMSFTILAGAAMVEMKLVGSNLFAADFSGGVLVQADLTGANLRETNFTKACLSRTNLVGSDVMHADFRGATELTCEQLTSAKNWTQALRDPTLECGAAIPSGQKSTGQKIRELLRQTENPYYPFHLVTVIHPDGKQETIAERDEGR